MTFTDFAALVAGQKLCCGWCEATRDQSVMRELQRSVITSHGVYSIATDDARAWFLLTPPPPPFVAVLQTRSPTATFHLHWKTPVTLDQDLLQVRVDDRLLVIRRQVLMKALNDCQTVADEMQARRQVAKRREALHHPYLSLDRNLTGTSHGVLHPEAVALADAKDCSVGVIAALNRLSTLLPGELWALATLAKANPPIPTRPPLITRVGQRKETAANVL
ncbi:MAG: hypothetical protein JNM52_09970 [Betaproteobacteria bacterium]|nr:hypothetical protein [Betaproteobacteria bacterium]